MPQNVILCFQSIFRFESSEKFGLVLEKLLGVGTVLEHLFVHLIYELLLLHQLLKDGVNLLLLNLIELFHMAELVLLACKAFVLALDLLPHSVKLFVYLFEMDIVVKTLVEHVLELVFHALALLLSVHEE